MGASERRSKGAALMARRIARAAVLALVYIALTKLGLKFAQLTPSSTVVWPGTGVAVVGTLLFGYETVPVWVIAAFFTNITTSGSLAPSLLIALGNGLEALAGAWLIRRYAGGVSAFDGPRSTFYAIGCLAAAAAVSATLGIVALHPWQLIAVGRLPWLIWWWGDLTGAVLIVPCFLSWAEWDRHLPATRPALEICALWLILLVLGALVFVRTETYSLTFLIIFLLAWAALRLGRRVTTTSILALDCFASVMTVHGLGPFTHGGRGTALVVMQLFFGSLAVTKLLIANTVEQRQKAMTERDLFVSATVHELRSPLTTVHGGLQLLARRLGQSGANGELIANILGQSGRLVDAMNNLSEARAGAARSETGAVVDLRDVVADAVAGRAVYDDAVQVENPDEPCPVQGDATRLEQVVTNLLDNGQKYGGNKPREVSLNRDPGRQVVTLSVTDFGIGIAADELEAIFRPYYRTNRAMESGQIGSGLGLHVVKSIVEGHGGSVSVRSEVGNGSTFEVRLPLAHEPAAAS